MQHTLNRTELKEIINVLCLKLKTFDDENLYLQEYLTDSFSWDRKIFSLNHILSIVLEQLEKKRIDSGPVINYIYELQEKCNFEVQEGDLRFIDSLFRNNCGSEIDLEEELIIAQNRLEK